MATVTHWLSFCVVISTVTRLLGKEERTDARPCTSVCQRSERAAYNHSLTMHLAFQVLRWLLGGLLYLAAILLYENEEGKVQNRLEELWLKVAYRKDAELSRATRFLQGVAGLSNRAFDSVLGKRLWSLQAVGASLWFSLASMWLTVLFMALAAPHMPRIISQKVVAPPHLWLSLIACIGLGILPSLAGRLWAFGLWTLVVFIFLFRSAGFVLFAVQKYGYTPVLLRRCW